ncbi:hypothetical protein [Flavobacterium sp. C3NV]|uniref:hypothetical protein n=1 Tax=Flavobacterium sp. C3NV TaxID=3393358 RepID=UPI00398FC004
MNKIKQFFCILLIINILISLLIIFSNLFSLKEPFQNITAINHQSKYLINDVLVLDTIITTSKVKDGSTSYSTTIRGKLLNRDISKEINFLYQDNSYNKLIFDLKYKNRNQQGLEVYRNILNDNIFLKDYKFLKYRKTDALLKIYFICSLVPSLFFMVILLKNKRNSAY